MTNPQTRIQERIRARVQELGRAPEEIAASIALSPLYGEFSYSTYRNLVTYDFESDTPNRVQFTKQLLIAFSAVLECKVSDLATDYELSTLRDLPYRRAQWPQSLLENESDENPGNTVPFPARTAAILVAYMRQYGIQSYAYFAQCLSNNGYPITSKQLIRAIGPKRNNGMTRRYVTYDMCEAAAKIFRRGPFGPEEFRTEWLITCRTDGRCPHCDPRLISY